MDKQNRCIYLICVGYWTFLDVRIKITPWGSPYLFGGEMETNVTCSEEGSPATDAVLTDGRLEHICVSDDPVGHESTITETSDTKIVLINPWKQIHGGLYSLNKVFIIQDAPLPPARAQSFTAELVEGD